MSVPALTAAPVRKTPEEILEEAEERRKQKLKQVLENPPSDS